jgi:hypothetical protein
MSNIALNILVGTALTDTRFCERLLNGSCQTLMADFDLSDEERRAIMKIRAQSIQEFAAELSASLDSWAAEGHRPSVTVLARYSALQSSEDIRPDTD